MDTPTVYRTRDPELLAAWAESQAGLKTWTGELKSYVEAQGLAGRRVYFNSLTGAILGIEHSDGQPVPDGWRVDRRRGLVPARAKKAGREIAAHLDRLHRPDPRGRLAGMPATHFAGLDDGRVSLLAPKVELKADGALYAVWPGSAPHDEIDHTRWELVRLSEYYALLEREEPQAIYEAVTGGQH
jgi:hypothetical protein